MDVRKLISGSVTFSKSSVNVWKFLVNLLLKPGLENFEHYFAMCEMSTIVLISHSSKVMLKILQARLQQYMNQELPDVQAGFWRGRGTRDQIVNIHWLMEKAREFQENICFVDYARAFDCVDHHKREDS